MYFAQSCIREICVICGRNQCAVFELRVPGGHDFYPHRLVPCPRLPAAALNQRYGPSAPRRCISRVPAPQTNFPVLPPPGRAKLQLSRKPSRQPRASPPPNLARSSSPSGTTRRNSCDGAPQLAQGTALRFVGYREFGLIVPRHPAHPREVAGVDEGLHSESPGIGAEPARVPEPVGTSLREANTSK